MQFTDEQQSAVHTTDPKVLVIAPPGSGKTRTLAGRILHLLQTGVRPSSILALTFTRRAATEMRERLLHQMGGEGAEAEKVLGALSIGTVHATCLDILRTYGDRLGYDPETLTVLDEGDADLVLERAAKDLGFLQEDGKWRSGISMVKIKRRLEQAYCNEHRKQPETRLDSHLEKIIVEYHNQLRALNSLDYGLILSECRRLFTEYPEVLETYQRRFMHVCVDEGQDSSAVEFSLYEALCPPSSIFIVADLAQSIYASRNARPDLLRTWIGEGDFTVYHLTQCFRCGDEIVSAANELIRHNGDPLARPMVGATGRSGYVQDLQCETEALAHHCANLRAKYDLADIAIIARTHYLLRKIQGAFLDHHPPIPSHHVGDRRTVFDSKAFRILHAIMRLYVNRRDNIAFERVAGLFEIDRYQRSHIRAKGVEQGTPLIEIAMRHFGRAPTIKKIGQYLNDEHGYELRDLLKDLENLHGLSFDREWEFWSAHCGEMSVLESLMWFSTYDPERGDGYRKKNAVTLITAHAAKGLEWPVVIMACLHEGSLPSIQSIRAGDDVAIQEERRLCYVGCTRARERLVLHHDPDESEPSRFLDEFGLAREDAS